MEIFSVSFKIKKKIKTKIYEQKIEKIQEHCDKLNKQENNQQFFKTYRILSYPYNRENDKGVMRCKTLNDELNNVASTAQEKANLFANRLQRVHSTPEAPNFKENWKRQVQSFVNQNQDKLYHRHTSFSSIHEDRTTDLIKPITDEEYNITLAKCKASSATGLDNVSYKMLRHLPTTYKCYIIKMMSKCLQQGYFPASWKDAKTILVPKPDKNAAEAKNYRPISLLSCVGKLFERI